MILASKALGASKSLSVPVIHVLYLILDLFRKTTTEVEIEKELTEEEKMEEAYRIDGFLLLNKYSNGPTFGRFEGDEKNKRGFIKYELKDE